MRLLDRALLGLIDRSEAALARRLRLSDKTSAATKAALMTLYRGYRDAVRRGEPLPPARDTGLRVFSETDEDGVLLFLLGAVGMETRTFVDVGGGDGLFASNVANLAFNFGYHGLIIDADAARIARGERLYRRHPDTRVHPPRFVRAFVTRETIDGLITEAGLAGEIDVLSIDIDGNDVWIWEAITAVRPRIVIVETHVEYGEANVAVPYDPEFAWEDARFVGASPTAVVRLGERRGYRLVGSNRFGYNAFFLREDLGEDVVPTLAVSDLLAHPRTRARQIPAGELAGFPFVAL